MPGGPAGVRIKGRDIFHKRIEVEIKKHLPFFLIGTEKIFSVVA